VAPAITAAMATSVVFRNCRRASVVGPLWVMVVLRRRIHSRVCAEASRCSIRTPNNVLAFFRECGPPPSPCCDASHASAAPTMCFQNESLASRRVTTTTHEPSGVITPFGWWSPHPKPALDACDHQRDGPEDDEYQIARQP